MRSNDVHHTHTHTHTHRLMDDSRKLVRVPAPPSSLWTDPVQSFSIIQSLHSEVVDELWQVTALVIKLAFSSQGSASCCCVMGAILSIRQLQLAMSLWIPTLAMLMTCQYAGNNPVCLDRWSASRRNNTITCMYLLTLLKSENWKRFYVSTLKIFWRTNFRNPLFLCQVFIVLWSPNLKCVTRSSCYDFSSTVIFIFPISLDCIQSNEDETSSYYQKTASTLFLSVS